MKQYTIRRTAVPPGGAIDHAAWNTADVLAIDRFPWHEAGRKQLTRARLLYDDQALYVHFTAEDVHSSARVAELNGPVCTDSCVEVFASVEPDERPHYFNFEANCCGQFHLGFGPDRNERRLIQADLADRIKVATSVAGATKAESPDDEQWRLVARLPFDVLSEFTGRPVRPRPGDAWRGNLYRCGGETDPQFACWNPIDTSGPDFHRPECFGRLIFE